MKSRLWLASATTLAVLALSCGGSPAMSLTEPSRAVSRAGAWNGRSVDSQGATIVTWALVQTGTSVSGTVKTQAVDPTDGSCNSCHRNKTGTLTGTISGTVLTVTMFFVAGGTGDPTPECSATLTGSASNIAGDQLTVAYTGADTCEGPFMDGTLAMAHNP